jgi:hypothetical protein
MLRIATGLFAVSYLTVRLPAFLALAHTDRHAFDPVGVLWLLPAPLPGAAVTGLVFLTLTLAAVYTVGIGFRVVGPAFAVALLVVTTYRSSWGQVLWFEALMVLHVLIVGFAPSADALAVRRHASPEGASQAYGAPVRLAAAVTVTTSPGLTGCRAPPSRPTSHTPRLASTSSGAPRRRSPHGSSLIGGC